MKNNLLEKIDALPPLPKSVIDLEEFRKSTNKEPLDLLKIIEQDPLIITTLLKVANSAMFGFRHAVESPSRAINLLGVNFTISIALGSIVQDLIKSNLDSYKVSTDDFMFTSNLASNLVNSWVGAISFDLKEELLLPAFLQETGKFILSELIHESGKVEEFQDAIKKGDKELSEIENEFVGYSCSKITANIFKHWKLSHNLIFAIGFVGDLKNCPDEFKEKAQILEVIKILSDITNPMSEKNITKALKKAKEYNLDSKLLSKAIEKIQTKLEDEE
mgnify:CR=1 FL=1